MHVETIAPDFEAWRAAARRLISAGIPPAEVWWNESDSTQLSLLSSADDGERSSPLGGEFTVPAKFISIAARVACFRDPERWSLLYRVLWRLSHGEMNLLEIPIDDDIRRLETMDAGVRRDAHKMTAFVRFRRVEREGVEHFIAWHRPEHLVVKLTAPLFCAAVWGNELVDFDA